MLSFYGKPKIILNNVRSIMNITNNYATILEK